MNQMVKFLTTAVALLALVGCGASPTAPSRTVKRSVKPVSATTLKSTTGERKAAPTVSTRPGARPATSKPAAPKQPAQEAPAPAPDGGTLKLKVAVVGNAPVATLAVKIFEQADPTLAMDVPLTVVAGAANWEQSEVPPGRYTFQVKALGADGTFIGQGNAETVVKAGEISLVDLQLRANVIGTQDTSGQGHGPGAVLDLNIEIL